MTEFKNTNTNEKRNRKKRKLLSPKMDLVFQVLFGEVGNENITKNFLEAILQEPIKDVDLSKNPILRRESPKGKMGVLDVIAEVNGTKMCNIEMQMKEQDDLISRLLYYWARTYERNIHKSEEYNTLKRTIEILIANFEIPGLEELEYCTDWKLIETKGRKVILTDFIEIVIIELPKIYRLNENEKDNKLLDWLYFLENPSSEKVKKIMEENEGVKEARDKLEEISDDVIMQRLADYRESAIWEEKAARRTATRKGLEEGMKKGLKQGLKQGMEQGMKQGIKEGREEGREEGRKSEKIELAKKMKNKGFSIQEIIDITELSKEEVEKI